jgi:hypothetical protein
VDFTIIVVHSNSVERDGAYSVTGMGGGSAWSRCGGGVEVAWRWRGGGVEVAWN